MFRSKESSNRIELSRLVQDLLNFGVLGSLQLWGWGWGVVGGWGLGWGWLGVGVGVVGGAPQTHAHVHMVNMIISCKWPPPLGEYLGFPMMSYVHAHVCMCMHVYACACE